MGGFNLSVDSFFLLVLVLVLGFTQIDKVVSTKSFVLTKYGAKSNGKSDCTSALLAAWKDACQTPGGAMVLVPSGKYLTAMAFLKGPCKGPMTFKLDGVLLATKDLSKYQRKNWISFEFIKNFKLIGRGTFDGQGQSAWANNKRTGKTFPTVRTLK